MRHQAQTPQITRLLLQKLQAYAELDENSRIALSILGDNGWSVERIGVNVLVTATPISQPSAVEEANAALAEAQAKFILLRKEMEQLKAKRAAAPWLFAGFTASAIGLLSLHGWGGWGLSVGALFGFIGFVLSRRGRRAME